jgi:hypothetical protein
MVVGDQDFPMVDPLRGGAASHEGAGARQNLTSARQGKVDLYHPGDQLMTFLANL